MLISQWLISHTKLLIFGDPLFKIIGTTSFGYHLFKKSKIFTEYEKLCLTPDIQIYTHDRYSNCNSVINKQVYPENTIDYIFRTDHLIFCTTYIECIKRLTLIIYYEIVTFLL